MFGENPCDTIMIKCTLKKYLIGVVILGSEADQNDTNVTDDTTVDKGLSLQLWRIQGNLDEEVIDEFYERGAVDEDSFTWTAFPYLEDINRYLVKLASSYPYVTVTAIGWTSRHNPISMLKISNERPGNHAILIEAGMHGNEWTTVLSALYFIDSIIPDYKRLSAYLKNRDWYIIPVLNPDGYQYSIDFDKTWNKNRRKFNDGCIGVDLNRNFNYNWSLSGYTRAKCDSSYSGSFPFSEEESKAFKVRPFSIYLFF
ncbi:zinc carboxypeptidase A 1-like [Trichoplusia ni]|uniref:Zinc carboxypeptidase A 1-like n=1 Tax=Trichoplusia ni TaxID=7111 RepID=A0A7E5V975_TRINI|nr:zinc carboxypeptidase A 1-like [Trichoplusia ni]